MGMMNIRNDADRNAILARGFRWGTVIPRGDSKGRVVSKHRTYGAADKAAKGRDLCIVDVAEAHTY